MYAAWVLEMSLTGRNLLLVCSLLFVVTGILNTAEHRCELVLLSFSFSEREG
jgi:hypothetical protein